MTANPHFVPGGCKKRAVSGSDDKRLERGADVSTFPPTLPDNSSRPARQFISPPAGFYRRELEHTGDCVSPAHEIEPAIIGQTANKTEALCHGVGFKPGMASRTVQSRHGAPPAAPLIYEQD